jgi:hypothetical protein
MIPQDASEDGPRDVPSMQSKRASGEKKVADQAG